MSSNNMKNNNVLTNLNKIEYVFYNKIHAILLPSVSMGAGRIFRIHSSKNFYEDSFYYHTTCSTTSAVHVPVHVKLLLINVISD